MKKKFSPYILGIIALLIISLISLPACGAIQSLVQKTIISPEINLHITIYNPSLNGFGATIEALISNANSVSLEIGDLLAVVQGRSGKTYFNKTIPGGIIPANSTKTFSYNVLIPLSDLTAIFEKTIDFTMVGEAGVAGIKLPVKIQATVDLPNLSALLPSVATIPGNVPNLPSLPNPVFDLPNLPALPPLPVITPPSTPIGQNFLSDSITLASLNANGVFPSPLPEPPMNINGIYASKLFYLNAGQVIKINIISDTKVMWDATQEHNSTELTGTTNTVWGSISQNTINEPYSRAVMTRQDWTKSVVNNGNQVTVTFSPVASGYFMLWLLNDSGNSHKCSFSIGN